MQTGMYMGGCTYPGTHKNNQQKAQPLQPSMSVTPAESHVGLLVNLSRNFRVGKGWELGEPTPLSAQTGGQ